MFYFEIILKVRNKIQDRYKSDVYVVVGHHDKPNMYYVSTSEQRL